MRRCNDYALIVQVGQIAQRLHRLHRDNQIGRTLTDEVRVDVKIGLDVPAVARIAAELKRRGIDIDGELYTVDGVKKAIMSYIGRSNG